MTSSPGVYFPAEERLFLLKSWSRLLQAGFPMHTSLDHLARATRRKAVRLALFRSRTLLESGRPFDESIAASGLFPPTWVALLAASWTRGDISPLLNRLQDRVQEMRRIRQQLISALTVPAILLVLVLVWVWVFVTRVAPTLAELLNEWAGSLRLVVVMAEAAYWIFFVGVIGLGAVVVLAVIGWRVGRSHQIMGPLQSSLPTWVPWAGPMIARMHLIVVASELQLQLEVGMPVMTALDILHQGISNPRIRRDLKLAYERLRAGFPVSVALSGLRVMSSIAPPLLAAGEQSGKIPDMLGVVVREAEYDLQACAQRLVTAVNIFVVAVSALIISSIVVAFMLLLLYSMGAAAQNSFPQSVLPLE